MNLYATMPDSAAAAGHGIAAVLHQWLPFLDAGLYGLCGALALLLRFGRAYWRWCDEPHTLLAAMVLGLGGAWLDLTIDGHPWQLIVLQGFALAVGVLLSERLLRWIGDKTAGRFVFLPRDNEWADDLRGAGVNPRDKVEGHATGGE